MLSAGKLTKLIVKILHLCFNRNYPDMRMKEGNGCPNVDEASFTSICFLAARFYVSAVDVPD